MLKSTFSVEKFKNLYLKVRSKGLLVTVAIASALFLVLSSGVGVTLAATGVIQIPSATPTPTATPTPSPTATSTPKPNNGSTAQSPANSGVELPEKLFNGGAIDESAMKRAGASGWTGVRVYFDNQILGAVIGARPKQSNGWVDGSWTFDGRTSSFGASCARDNSGTCLMYLGGPTIIGCADGKEYTIRVIGSGLNITQTGRIPVGASNCPPPPAPEPAPPSPPAPEPAPPAPEPSPTSSEEVVDPSTSPTPAQ